MNNWQLDTWKHINDMCPNWWIGFAYGFIVAAMIMFLLQTRQVAKATRKLINDIDARAKGQPGERCLVCHHTRAEGYRFMYPFNQSICSNCMVDDEIISEYVNRSACHIAEMSLQVADACQETQDLHRDRPLDPHRGPRLQQP